jgi:hypothetical protein
MLFWLVLVCGLVKSITEGPVCSTHLNTFDSKESCIFNNQTVLHCGACGYCSNPNDVNIYKEFTNSMTTMSKKCALKMFFLGRKAGQNCMKKSFGFTDQCISCWLDDMQCSSKKCWKPCLKKYFSIKGQIDGNDECIKCDEDLCGPKFKECSGANRRRLGIKSDIDRDEQEICKLIGQ